MSETLEKPLTASFETFLGYQLRRLSAAAMADLADALAEEGLSPTLATVLLIIETNPGETQARIGRALSIKRANIAPMIAKLEDEGLIRKSGTDGRSFALYCTAKGTATARRAEKVMRARERKVFGALSSEETKLFLSMIERARSAL